MKHILLTLFTVFTHVLLYASHIAGGNITYRCVGPNQYEVTLTQYRDCYGINPSNTQTIRYRSTQCNVNATVTLNLIRSTDITPLCPSVSSRCNGGNGPFGYEEIIYRGTVTLPSGCTDWTFSAQECCRNSAITNLTSAQNVDFYIESQLNNLATPCNNSPTFPNHPQLFGCVGQAINYQVLAVDEDGDELVYSLVNAMSAPNTNVAYAGGFSGASPFNVPATIDAQTGEISFTPTVAQVAVVTVLVQEYRNGVLVGSVMRDLQFNIAACTNSNPTLSGINNIPNNYSITTCANAELCFNINATDVDNGNNLTFNFNNPINGSTFTTSGTGNNITGRFCWTPTLDDIGTHFITVNVNDDNCPLIGQYSQTYEIIVAPNPHPPVSAGQDVLICAGASTTLTASTTAATSLISGYIWSPPLGLSTTQGNTTNASPTLTTNYLVTLTYTDGCTSTDVVQVTVGDLPNVSVFPSTINVCSGNDVQISGTANIANAGFNWTNASNTSLGTGTVNSNSTSLTITAPTTSGSYTYTLTGTHPVTGCSSSDQIQVIVGTPPSIPMCVNIYASPTGLSSAAGTQADPTSITEAILRGQCQDAVIKLAIGTYTINNPITLSNYITLEGGFDPANNWEKTSLAGATTIIRSALNVEGPTTAPRLVAFYANSAIGFRLQDLTIRTANAPTSTTFGVSTYGLHLTACSDYYIVRCQILTGNAGAGANGIAGTAGLPGSNGMNGYNGSCDGGSCTFSSGHAGGAGGNSGAGGGGTAGVNGGAAQTGNNNPGVLGVNATLRNGASGGSGGAGGDECSTNVGAGGAGGRNMTAGHAAAAGGNAGASGNPGTAGGNGAAGAAGSAGTNGAAGSAGYHAAGFYIPGGMGGTGTDGTGGSGGGGGGGGGRQQCTICDNGPGNGGGGGGGGGQGGTPGQGGYGGGSSFGIYLFNNGANGNIDQSLVQSGALGFGGTGGLRGNGGAGGAGGIGASACTSEVGRGGNGGAGGAGGAGGFGGNGQAGHAQGIYFTGGTVPATNVNSFNLAAQPVIRVSNINCTNTPVNYTSANANTWDFDVVTNAANPADAGSTTNATTEYTEINRYTVQYGSNQYNGFHNISYSGAIRPDILTNATHLSGDTFQICQGEFVNFQSVPLAEEYIWDFHGGATNPSSAQLVGTTFNTPGFFPIQLNLVTDCCGLSLPSFVYLFVLPTPTPTGAADHIACVGSETTLTVNGLQPSSTLQWSPLSAVLSQTTNTLIVSPSETTQYMATAQSTLTEGNVTAIGCPVQLLYNVQIINPPTLVVTANPINCTDNGSASANVTGSEMYNLIWSSGQTHSNVNQGTVNGLVAGTYNIIATGLQSGCEVSQSFLISPSPTSPQVYLASNNSSCVGQAQGSVTLNVNGGNPTYTYNWNNTSSQTSSGPVTMSNLAPGTYNVVVNDANNCSSTLVVEVGGIDPPQYDVNASMVICPGDDAIFSVSGTDGAIMTYTTGDVEYTIVLNHHEQDIVIPSVSEDLTLIVVSIEGECSLPVNQTFFIPVDPCDLAVSFTDFQFNCQGRLRHFNWSTLTEQNNAYFTIEQSKDGFAWEVLKQIDGNGNSTSTHSYQATITDEGQNIKYYRLRQTDFDGKTELLKIVINNCQIKEEPTLTIYPNPTRDYIQIALGDQKTGLFEITTTDLIGKVVGKSTIKRENNEDLRLDLKNLANGSYKITVVHKETQTSYPTESVIVIK